MRLRVLQDAGRLGIPFTTGLLIGIGETHAERADSLLALRSVAREFHGIQEVIVQNFRAHQTRNRGTCSRSTGCRGSGQRQGSQ